MSVILGKACWPLDTSLQSIFTRKRIISRSTEKGCLSLDDNRLIVPRDGQRSESLVGKKEYDRLLKKQFGVVLQRPMHFDNQGMSKGRQTRKSIKQRRYAQVGISCHTPDKPGRARDSRCCKTGKNKIKPAKRAKSVRQSNDQTPTCF